MLGDCINLKYYTPDWGDSVSPKEGEDGGL